MDTDRIRALQALRLKGRIPAEDLPAAAGLDGERVTAIVGDLISGGQAEEIRGRLKLSASGRRELDELLTGERQTIDRERIRALYDEFEAPNGALKALMTRWQLKSDDVPNDHSDAEYDGAVIDDLVRLDMEFEPLLSRLVAAVARLGHYPDRFDTALTRVRAGDHSWFARPLADSYHTVWFELHEELIGLAGLSRAAEAAAGRAE
jgi:pyruvate,orthophosphate dikinase